MRPIDRTEPSQSTALEFEVELPHPPARVWRAISDPALLERWLLPSVGFDLAPGTQFTFRADPQPGWDGVVHCRILEIEEGRKLKYGWVVGELDTVVTLVLEPRGDGSHLHIRQSGFRDDQKRNFGGARYGWRMMLERLVETLEENG